MPTTVFTLNGKKVQASSDPTRMLAWVLRQELGLTGTKVGCGEGICGACTVLVDLEPTRACITPLRAIAGRSVLTIEGLGQGATLNPVQSAFEEHHAFQCGFCTPGMILTAYALVKKNPRATRAQILEHMDGNLCRCGAHLRILDAVEAAAKTMGGAL